MSTATRRCCCNASTNRPSCCPPCTTHNPLPTSSHVSPFPPPPHPQEVLLQRSDVEAFLLSSLHAVRREIERESLFGSSAPDGHGLGPGSGTHPRIASDIKDLPWEDRERVLRLLFAKINNQAQSVHFTSLPPHPLSGQSDALYALGAAGMLGPGVASEAGPAALV